MKEQIKKHFQKNKTKYLMGGTFVLGIGVTALYFKVKPLVAVNNTNVSGVFYKSPTVIHTTNVYQQTLVRRGHPGNMVKCLETGEVFASQGRAAEAFGINRSTLSKHLNGLKDSVNDLHFEKIGEMQ